MEFDTQDAQDAKIWSILAYFGILFFLPLVGVPNSAYGKFHANQGLILLILMSYCQLQAGLYKQYWK